jgi:hypothetical protein
MAPVVATPRAPFRPVWVPVPFLARSRKGLAWTAVTGVLAVAVLVLVAQLDEGVSLPTVLAALALAGLTLVAAFRAVRAIVAAVEVGPGDAMSVYGPGRRVEVTWTSRGREHGRIAVEDVGHGEVVALRRDGPVPSAHVTVRLGGHDLLLQGDPSVEATWYTVVDEDGYTLARADASPGPVRRGLVTRLAPVDWTVSPARGPVLRLRHGRGAHPPQVTLLDDTGTAWWVREGRLAELPDDLDPISAVFVVLLVDQLGRTAGVPAGR